MPIARETIAAVVLAEALSAYASGTVRKSIVEEALIRAGASAPPEDANGLLRFAETALHDAVVQRLGHDAASAVVAHVRAMTVMAEAATSAEELTPTLRPSSPSDARRRIVLVSDDGAVNAAVVRLNEGIAAVWPVRTAEALAAALGAASLRMAMVVLLVDGRATPLSDDQLVAAAGDLAPRTRVVVGGPIGGITGFVRSLRAAGVPLVVLERAGPQDLALVCRIELRVSDAGIPRA